MSEPIHLIDVAAFLHRAMYVTYGDRASEVDPSDSRFTSQACAMLANLMERLNIRRMAVVRDSTEPSYRCDIFPAYKADRKPHTPVFAAQAPRFFDALCDVSVAVVGWPRFEADDLIASMIGQEQGARYVIVSSDKDMLANLADPSERTSYYDPMKQVWVTRADVREKFGVDARQLYDYIGLVGDSSDGIPGVKSIGVKTAAKLLREFDSLDQLYERRQALVEHVGARQVAALDAGKDDAFLSRKLARPWLCSAPETHVTGAYLDAPAPEIVRKACG